LSKCSVRLDARVASEKTPTSSVVPVPHHVRSNNEGKTIDLSTTWFSPLPKPTPHANVDLQVFVAMINSRPRQHFTGSCHDIYISDAPLFFWARSFFPSLSLQDVFYESSVSTFACCWAGGLCQWRCVDSQVLHLHPEANMTLRHHCLWHKLLIKWRWCFIPLPCRPSFWRPRL
jgi:hypothetical protein